MSKDDGLAPDGRSGSSQAAGRVIVCGGNETETPWTAVLDKWPEAKGSSAIVRCCNRIVPVDQCETRFITAYGGYVANHEARCAPGKGCNANAGAKRTAHLREGWYGYDDTPFIAACSEAEATQREGEARSQPQHPKE